MCDPIRCCRRSSARRSRHDRSSRSRRAAVRHAQQHGLPLQLCDPVIGHARKGRLGERVRAGVCNDELVAAELAVALPLDAERTEIGAVVIRLVWGGAMPKRAASVATCSHSRSRARQSDNSARKLSRSGAASASGGRACTSSLSSSRSGWLAGSGAVMSTMVRGARAGKRYSGAGPAQMHLGANAAHAGSTPTARAYCKITASLGAVALRARCARARQFHGARLLQQPLSKNIDEDMLDYD